MNNGFTAEGYAAIVNLYGGRLRQIAPEAVIIACGQKRSNDMAWSEKVIDLAGNNFDVLGVHNYEYESDLFESGVRRIRDYLLKLRDYVRASPNPGIKLAGTRMEPRAGPTTGAPGCTPPAASSCTSR